MNCAITAKDTFRAYDIGAFQEKANVIPSIPNKGKTLLRTAQADQRFNIDITIVDGHASLITSLPHSTVWAAIQQRCDDTLLAQLALCSSQKYKIKKITTFFAKGEGDH